MELVFEVALADRVVLVASRAAAIDPDVTAALSAAAMAQQSTYMDCRNSSIAPGQSLCCEIQAPQIHEIPVLERFGYAG